jgi:hypothetical protein
MAAASSVTKRWRASLYCSRSLGGSGRSSESTCRPFTISARPDEATFERRSVLSRARFFQSRDARSESDLRKSKTSFTSGPEATRRTPFLASLSLGTFTLAPVSRNVRLTKTSFWPAISSVLMSVTAQRPWFG